MVIAMAHHLDKRTVGVARRLDRLFAVCSSPGLAQAARIPTTTTISHRPYRQTGARKRHCLGGTVAAFWVVWTTVAVCCICSTHSSTLTYAIAAEVVYCSPTHLIPLKF